MKTTPDTEARLFLPQPAAMAKLITKTKKRCTMNHGILATTSTVPVPAPQAMVVSQSVSPNFSPSHESLTGGNLGVLGLISCISSGKPWADRDHYTYIPVSIPYLRYKLQEGWRAGGGGFQRPAKAQASISLYIYVYVNIIPPPLVGIQYDAALR